MRDAGLAMWATAILLLVAGAAAKEHKYKQGQEVSIWANKGRLTAALLPPLRCRLAAGVVCWTTCLWQAAL
jgi:hypothetical protein